MMLTLHGFPANTKYADVKSLLKQECKIIDFLLDNLVSEGANFKKVRVGLASDAEGYKVMNIINGYQFQGNTLQAVPFGAEPSKPAKPGYQSQEISKFSNQQNNDYQNHPRNDFGPPGNYTRGPGQHNPNPHNQSQFGNSPRIQGHDIGGPHSQGPFGGGPRGLPGTQDDVFRSSGGNQDYSGRHGQWGHEMGPDGPKSQPWANNSSNQWGGDLNAGGPIGQNTYGSQQQNNPYFNQQPMQTENRQYGQDRDRPLFHPQIKAVQSTRGSDIQRNNLRVLEPMEISNTPDRFPTNFHPENKRVTIMKDNFQGPTQYNINNPDGSGPAFRATGNSQPWNQQGQQLKPNPNFDQRKYLQENESRGSPMDRRPSPSDRRISPGRRFSPSGKRVLPPGRRISPTGRRISPTGRRISPTARRISPAGRRFSPGRQISPGRRMSPGRRFSPSGRRLSPSGRRFSPSGRRISPGRQVLPNRKISPSGTHILASRRFSPGGRVSPGRRMSPGRRVSPGRRIMPQGRMASPTGRRISPGRRLSPGTRMSPNRRISPMMANKILTGGDRGVLGHPMRRESPHKRLSPGRRMPSPNRPGMRGDSPSRQHGRYSPVRQALDRTMDKFGPDKMKPIRPAYEPEQAPNQTTYAGGYRPGPPDTVQYPTPGARVGDKRVTPWEKPAPKTDDTQDRRGLDRERERGPDPRADGERPHSSGRRSRSPVRQRSPFSSRFRKPSPSSRSSRSPRRSWALEKRRSPAPVDAPPPPAWPAPEPEPQPQPAPPPVWERHQFSDDKVRAALLERERLSQRSDADRFSQREPRPSPRREFRRESPDRKPFRTDDPRRRAPDDDPRRRAPDDDPRARVDFQHEREPSPRLNLKKSQFLPSIDKDFEDIYHRTLEFKKKAEELRRLNKREKDDVEERSHREREREEESRSFRYDEKRYRPEDQETSRERRHGTDSPTDRNDDHRPVRFSLKSNTKAKREKAVKELVKKMFERHESLKHLKGDQKCRINEELQLAVSRAVYEMFGDNEVSFIEIIIKFQARYSLAGEANMIDDVLKSFPSHIRIPKRHAPEAAEVPSSKVGRRSHTPVKARRSSPVKNTALIMKPPISYNAAQKVGAPGRASRKRNKEKKQKARKTSPAKPALQPIPAKKPVQRAPVKAIIKEEPKEVKKPVEIKKEVEKKEAEDVEVTSAMQTGRYELNELMTRMVEKELQDIMIKVWQVLPDNPPEEEDELVVATFRNEAGDHLRNVLGLNITQRLLNIHNPLYVKVQFSGKPEKADLREFLKKYNFSGFKRIQSAVNMFAAQVKTINDFDRLCTDKDIKCGIAKVTVVPIYKFSKCPPNLITSFNITDEDTDMQSKDNNITDVDNNETSKGTNNPDIIQKPVVVKVEKPDDIQETVENKPKIVNKVDTKPVLENKVDKTTINNQPNDKPTIKNQPNNKPTIKNQPNVKPTIKNEPDDKPTIKNQSNDITTKEKVEAKNNVQNTPTPAAVRKTKPIETKDVKTVETKPVVSEKQLKPVVSEKQVKPVVSGKQMKAVVSEKQVKPMVSEKQVKPVVSEKQVKPVVSEKQVKPVVSEKQMKPSVSEKQVKPVVSEKQVKPVETKPTIVKTPVKATETKKLMTTPSEPKNITPTKNKVTPISKPVAKESKVENDFDELDDYDILALMSEGIVLDECEGSDDD